MQRHKVLINLGLALVLMFGAAFSCGPSKNTDRTPRSDRLTEEVVTESVTRQKTATSIESVEIGSPHTANANDEFRGIPKEATVYPVKVRYTYIDTYYIDHREVKEYYAFDFYRDSFGEWHGASRGPVANQPAG
jgi:hypothetical protein